MGVNKQLQGSIWMIERMLAALIVTGNNDSSAPCVGLLMSKTGLPNQGFSGFETL